MTATTEARTTQCPDANETHSLEELRAEIADLVALHPQTAQAIRDGVAIGLACHETHGTPNP